MSDLQVYLAGLRGNLDEMEAKIPKVQWVITIPIPGVDIDLHIAPESAISRYRTYVVGIAQKGKEPAGWYVYAYENVGDREWEPAPQARLNKMRGTPGAVPAAVVDLVEKWLAKQLPDPKYRKDFKKHTRV